MYLEAGAITFNLLEIMRKVDGIWSGPWRISSGRREVVAGEENEREIMNKENTSIQSRHRAPCEQCHGCSGVQKILGQTNSETYNLHTFFERVFLPS